MTAAIKYSERGSKQLNNQERQFVDYYLIDFDATSAAIKAGYSAKSAKTTGCILLKKPHIARALGKELREHHNDRVLEAGDILEQLYFIVTRDVREFVDDRGIALPIHCLGDRAAQSVDAFEQEVVEMINPATQEVIGRTIKNKLKLVGKAGAIEMAMKYRGLFAAEEHNVNHSGEVTQVFDFSKLTQPPKELSPVDKAFKELEAKGTIEQTQSNGPLVLEVKKNEDGSRSVKPKKDSGSTAKRGKPKKTEGK